MRFLHHLKIGQRLALALGLVLLMMAGVAVGGLWGLRSLASITQHALEQDVALGQQAARLRSLVLQERRFEKDSFINLGSIEALNGYVKKWNDTREALQHVLAETRRLELAPVDAEQLAQMSASFDGYVAGFNATLAGIRAGSIVSTQAANADIGKVKQSVHGMEAASDAINDRALQRVAEAAGKVERVRGRAEAWQTALALGGLLLGVALCWVLAQSITEPLRFAVKVANTVAAGDLRSRIIVTGRDESAELLASLRTMNHNLVRIVGEVHNASDSIVTGSSQIAAGSLDLSRRTELQASSLQQTAASVEELTAIVKQNASTALQASVLAREASEVALRGGAAIGDVMATMARISASSQKIAEITGVIDGIAFQTNILALNAAVEAARAGEQGRGFAVVANEVRSLAQRSAQAAREIKSLIGAGGETVEHGSQLVTGAGRTMQEIVAQVQGVSELIARISLSGSEQSSGIGQIGQAVNQLDRATQQNAALVEESASAADSLKMQAGRLRSMVGQFLLEPSAAA